MSSNIKNVENETYGEVICIDFPVVSGVEFTHCFEPHTCDDILEHCVETWKICTVCGFEYQSHRSNSFIAELLVYLGKIS